MNSLIQSKNKRSFWDITKSWADSFEKMIPIALVLILGLIIIIAFASGFDRHPDEKHHYNAANYYLTHWLPAQVGAPETAASYSQYGASYLNELDIVYLLSGKFTQTISPLISKQYLSMRLFNVLLFFILILYCAYFPKSRLIFIVLLITPQVWYIFSYFNNDAISLFISIVLICELVVEHSFFQRCLNAKKFSRFIGGGILCGLLLGILLICKRNYYIFILFILFIMFWQVWQECGAAKKQIVIRYLFVIALGLSIFFVRYAYDISINGWDKANKMVAYAENMAAPQYKPSVSSYYGLHLKTKGIKYSELFSKWKWHTISFKSFFGVYDYMKIFSSGGYYTLVFFIISLFLIYLMSSVLIKGESSDKLFMIIVVGFIVTSIFSSTYHSWVNDFQAQGRYLFPILGMLGVLLYHNQKVLNKSVLAIFVMVLFALSAYSFIFTGLTALMTSGTL